MAGKTVISYVSGCAGDFLVNCCNHVWYHAHGFCGTVRPSASIKVQEQLLNDKELQQHIDGLDFDYIGSHSIDRLLRLHVRCLWLVVPDPVANKIWSRRDAVTRAPELMLGAHGALHDQIKTYVSANQLTKAAKAYLAWLEKFNWTLMQMRLVQPSSKIDVSALLLDQGIQDIIQQMPELMAVSQQCAEAHDAWLRAQLPFHDEQWSLTFIGEKLQKFFDRSQ